MRRAAPFCSRTRTSGTYGRLRSRHHRRRHQRRRHRARRRGPRACACCCSSRTISRRGTSSASTKLIHGGLRYLEHGAFRLVREALTEREVLLRMAPHIVRPMRFVLPHDAGRCARPGCCGSGCSSTIISAARKILPRTRTLDLTPITCRRSRCSRRFRCGFEYSDCWVDDARLVVLNALDAAERGADDPHPHALRPRRARGRAGGSIARMPQGRREASPRASLVNAAGPWVGAVSRDRAAQRRRRRRSGWSRAATSWCRGCSTTTAPISSRTPTAASSSRSPIERRFHADRHHRRRLSRRSRRASRRAPTRSPTSAARSNEYLPRAGRARRGGLVLCRRARRSTTTAPASSRRT